MSTKLIAVIILVSILPGIPLLYLIVVSLVRLFDK